MSKKPVLVLKIGTAAITHNNGELHEEVLQKICQQVSVLQTKYNIILVSSGAVGAGRKYLNFFSGKLIEKKAAAAIGNPILIQKYREFLSSCGIAVAQALCERHHFSNRDQFLRLKGTFEELWKNNIIPIVNENDVISDRQLKFSDNDEMATLLAAGFDADKLLFGSSVEGLLNGDQLVKKIEDFDEKIFQLAHKGTSEFGLGGMISKLHCAKLATNLGTHVVIFNVKKTDNILRAEQYETGTFCLAKTCNISAHRKWMATGSLPSGKITIDVGAGEALSNRKSLLSVGVQIVEGNFKKGDVVEILIAHQEQPDKVFAVARTKISSKEIEALKTQKNIEIAHANEIVIF